MHRTAELVGLRRLTVTEATSRVAELREFGLHHIRAMETTTIVHEHFRSIQCSHANPRVRSAEGQPKDNVVCSRQSSKVSKCQEPRTSDPFGVLRIGTGMLIVFVESDTGKGRCRAVAGLDTLVWREDVASVLSSTSSMRRRTVFTMGTQGTLTLRTLCVGRQSRSWVAPSTRVGTSITARNNGVYQHRHIHLTTQNTMQRRSWCGEGTSLQRLCWLTMFWMCLVTNLGAAKS